jgi:hypothetical protein
MFEIKAGAFQELNFMVGSWLYPQTLNLARKACQGQTLQLNSNIHKLQL